MTFSELVDNVLNPKTDYAILAEGVSLPAEYKELTPATAKWYIANMSYKKSPTHKKLKAIAERFLQQNA